MLNYWLDILFLLLSAVLPLNVFSWAVAEVVYSVFFRDNVLIPTPGTTDCGSKSLYFCLYVYPLNSICPSF
jgi:hypothetical protein